jgi:hypothetical protein
MQDNISVRRHNIKVVRDIMLLLMSVDVANIVIWIDGRVDIGLTPFVLNFTFYPVKFVLVGSPVGCSGKSFVVTCCLDNRYCTLLVIIIFVNTIMIDIHANMSDRKQSDGKV